jgi:hypothetical protein
MINKSNISPIVVIGFLIFSVSMAASVNIHAGGPQSIECKNLKATHARIDVLIAVSKELGRNRDLKFLTIEIDKVADGMKGHLNYVNPEACGKKPPPGKPERCKRRDRSCSGGGGHPHLW